MVIILKTNHNKTQLDTLSTWLSNYDIKTTLNEGISKKVLALVGDTSEIDIDLIKALDFVEDVVRIQEPFKRANRKFHPDDTIVTIDPNIKIGGGHFAVIAGPCSVESEEQICTIAEQVKKSGATLLRGGAFKPRTSPYAFQGLRGEGIDFLLSAKKLTGLPIVTEIMDLSQLNLFAEIDVIQVGARNMQNFELLKELGKTNKPILLKRGLSSTFQELLMSAEYIMASGNDSVILCERGIRTFETYTRNTMDVSAVPALKSMSHLPIILDPSHATGIAKLVPPMAVSAAAVGADGLIIEVHNDPAHALSDGPQSLTPEAFETVMRKIEAIRPYSYNYTM
jgi:3-deoxy-7-phosphoheptulonate synthase